MSKGLKLNQGTSKKVLKKVLKVLGLFVNGLFFLFWRSFACIFRTDFFVAFYSPLTVVSEHTQTKYLFNFLRLFNEFPFADPVFQIMNMSDIHTNEDD